VIFERRGNRNDERFFSICIPQYNRTSFLIQALRSLEQQTLRDFEVCISDDCSTDGRQSEVLDFLALSHLAYVYRAQPRNGRYDVNLRSSISLAVGRFCFLLGNDDALADDQALEAYQRELQQWPAVGVATSNYLSAKTGVIVRRVRGTRVLPGKPATAARVYRNFSFVSGIVLSRERAQAHATDRWDGAEMYQTYLATRIIAEGYPLLCLDRVVIRMGVQVPGETVDSVFARARLDPCPIIERRSTLTEMGRLVADALQPTAQQWEWQHQVEWVIAQLYLFPYVYWLFTYRRIQSWNYALGICLGMRPRNVVDGLPLPARARIRLKLAYGLASLCGLVVPVQMFEMLTTRLLRIAKSLT
jgi:glycosyltransferase involved in cell wall biosynthesis